MNDLSYSFHFDKPVMTRDIFAGDILHDYRFSDMALYTRTDRDYTSNEYTIDRWRTKPKSIPKERWKEIAANIMLQMRMEETYGIYRLKPVYQA